MSDDAIVLDELDELVGSLRARGYRVVGPVLRDGAIVYTDIDSASDFPSGWTDEQAGGSYRVKRRDDDAVFGYAVGPHSWKKYLFPPSTLLWRARRDEAGFHEETSAHEQQPFAFIGVRSCELHAIQIQDRVFLGGSSTDPTYARARDGAFIVAVNCAVAGGTCFCASMGTGPRVGAGHDLCITELFGEEGHRFLIEIGTERGREIALSLKHRSATEAERREPGVVAERTAARMGRRMDTDGLKELLYANGEHPRWDDVASRCLTCGNCTLVCPTCFCSTVEESTDLPGNTAERTRVWDSCFTVGFSYIHGGSVRTSPGSRYRQWMTHKLSTWIDQFGTSGCVGCGRCITWCPVGIDITEEVAAIRATDGRSISDGVA